MALGVRLCELEERQIKDSGTMKDRSAVKHQGRLAERRAGVMVSGKRKIGESGNDGQPGKITELTNGLRRERG